MAHFAAVFLVAVTAAWAAPYVPKDDATVLERLPTRRGDPVMAELRQLRAALAASPKDAATATRLAQRYFDLAMADGDPRYVGYAEAALRRWPGDDAPADVLFARGLLRQYRHDFSTRHAGLRAGAGARPGPRGGSRVASGASSWCRPTTPPRHANAQPWASTRACCMTAGCIAYVEATTGKTRDAYQRLAAALERRRDARPRPGSGPLTRLAEMAWRLGDAGLAERQFTAALTLGVTDNFLLAAYADFLLEQGRPKEVVALLQDWVRSDTLLLRLAIAEHALGLPAAAALAGARASASPPRALRGDRLHMGEEARYLLDLKGDARAALAVGRKTGRCSASRATRGSCSRPRWRRKDCEGGRARC